MDFELNDDQKLLVENVQNFVKKDSPLSRARAARDEAPGYSKEAWAQMGELGWLAVPFSEEAGGLGLSFIDAALLLEQFGTTLVPEPYVPAVLLAGKAIELSGSQAQQQQYLGPLIEGQSAPTLAHVEPDSRHDVSCVKTRADKSGDGYTLSGSKRFVMHGDSADRLVVSARTSGEAGDVQGVSLFVVEGDASGLSRQRLRTMDGRYAAHLSLDGVQATLLGEEGTATPTLVQLMDLGAAAACAEGAGIAQAVLDMTKEYLGDREQFGVKIGSFQVLQHRVVDMFLHVQLAKSVMILSALRVDDDDPMERQQAVSTAKVQLAESGHFVTRQGIQLHGGIGVTDEHDVGLYYKRMNVLAALYGDEEFHVHRFANAPGFAGA